MKEKLLGAVLVSFAILLSFSCGYHIRGLSIPESEPEQVRVVSGTLEAPALHRYPVEKVLRVVDGDTLDVRFSVWEDIVLVKRLRLLGIDTPELRPRSGTEAERKAEKAAAKAALDYVETALTNAAAVFVVTDWKSDSFGRVLAGIQYVDESGTEYDLAARLLESGHAEVYEK